MKQNKGFTLIELLVVIAIIGIMSAIVLVSLSSVRMKARDSKRIQDFKQLQNALEMYALDHDGAYPTAGYWYFSTDGNWNSSSNPLYVALVPTYISILPVDPVNNSNSPWGTGNYSYAYGFNGSLPKYDLATQLEEQNSPNRCAVKNWVFYAGGGGSWCGGYSPYMYTGY